MPAPDAIRKRPGSPVLFGLPFRLDDLDGHRLDRLGRLLPGQLALELFLGLLLLLLVAGLAASCRHAITPIPWLAPVGRASKLKYPIRSRRCHGNRALRRAPATTVAPPSSAKSACRRARGRPWLSRPRVDDRHLEVGLEESAAAALRAAARFRVAVRDRAARLAPVVPL